MRRRVFRVLALTVLLLLALAVPALAASTVSITAPSNGDTSVAGSVTLGGGDTVTSVEYTRNGATWTTLTLTGNAFSIPVSSFADGGHTITVRLNYMEGGTVAKTATASRTVSVSGGAINTGGGTMESFSISLTGLGAAITQGITNLQGVWTMAAGLAVAGGVLGWGLGMIKRWRGR